MSDSSGYTWLVVVLGSGAMALVRAGDELVRPAMEFLRVHAEVQSVKVVVQFLVQHDTSTDLIGGVLLLLLLVYFFRGSF